MGHARWSVSSVRRPVSVAALAAGSGEPSRAPPTSSASSIDTTCAKETVWAEQNRTVEETVEPAARWLA